MHLVPASRLWAELPNFDLAITSTSNKPSRRLLLCASTRHLTRRKCRSPAHAIDAGAARLKDLMGPRIVFEFEDRDVAIRGGAGEETAGLVWGPGDEIDRGSVQGDIVDFLPLGRLFAPNENLAVVGRGGEDVAVFGMGLIVDINNLNCKALIKDRRETYPSYAPHRAFMSIGGR